MAPSGVHGQAAGAWKASEMAQAPGGPLRPLPPGSSNGAVAKRGLRSYPAKTRAPRRSSRSRVDKTAAMIEKSPSAGCRKAAVWGGQPPPEDRKILMEDRQVLLVAE